MKETSPQVSGFRTELFPGNQTWSTPVQSLNDSKKRQSEFQRHQMNMTVNVNGDDNNFLPKITNSQIEEQPVRDVITNELYVPLSSTIVLKRKNRCCMFLCISKTVDSGAYVSAITQGELEKIKRQAQPTFLKSTTLPIFNFKSQTASSRNR